MKRTFLCLLAAFALSNAFAAAAQPVEITASGTGTVVLAPDQVTVRAGIETNAESATEAVAQNNLIYERVVAALGKLGIGRDDVAFDYYSVNYTPRPQDTAAASPGMRYGYSISRTFSIRVRDLDKTGVVTDACIDSGATTISNVSFEVSDSGAARGKAIVKAIAEARTNAETMALAAGLHIVGIKSVEFLYAGQIPGLHQIARVAALSGPTEFAQSNVNVSATVTVVFLAQP
jgi:hypothetical protein